MLGIVVGLAAEARLARGFRSPVQAGGGGAEGAREAASRLVAGGVDTLLSFGLAGGLAPDLPAGAVLVPRRVVTWSGETWAADLDLATVLGTPAGTILAADDVLATSAEKRAAWEATGAVAADLESGAVARVAAQHGLRFAVIRAICDPADRTLPAAALTALDRHGRISPGALLRSLARRPGQIPALIALGREAALARSALLARVTAIGPLEGRIQ